MRNDYYASVIAILLAEQSVYWEAMETASRRMIERYPNYYTYYWKLAYSLQQQGKLAQAEEPVQVYLTYSHDEVDYQDVLLLLKAINAEKLGYHATSVEE